MEKWQNSPSDKTNIEDRLDNIVQTQKNLYKTMCHIRETLDPLERLYIAWNKSFSSNERKILMYYSNYSDDIIYDIYKEIENKHEKWNEYMMTLMIYSQQFIKAIQKFLEKDFFIQKSTDNDDKKMEEWVKMCIEKYPAVKSNVKYKYKNGAFHKMIQKEYSEDYIQKAQNVINDLFEIWGFVDLNSREKIYAFFADRILSLFQNNRLEVFYKKHLYDCIERGIKQSHEERIARQEHETQQKEVRKNKKDISDKTNTVGTTHIDTQNTTPDIIKKIIEDLSNVVGDELKDLENYLRRVYKKGTPVSIEETAKHLWDKINEKACHILIEALPKLGLDIRDGNKEVNELIQRILGDKNKTDIMSWGERKNTIQTPITTREENIKTDTIDNFSRQTTDSIIAVISPTLEAVKQDVNRLNTGLFVKILEEMGYKVLFKDQFIKESEKHFGHILNGEELKWDIINALNKPKIYMRTNRKAKNGVAYQRIKLVNRWYYRLVKQWNNVLWLTDFETYRKRVQENFSKNKTNYANM